MLCGEVDHKIFIEYFRDWNTKVSVSNIIYPKRRKKSPRKRGRIIPTVTKRLNKFVEMNYLDGPERKPVIYWTKYVDGEEEIKKSYSRVAYRGNLKPFFEYCEEKGINIAEIDEKVIKIIFNSQWWRNKISHYENFYSGVKSTLIEIVTQNLWYLKNSIGPIEEFVKMRLELKDGDLEILREYTEEKEREIFEENKKWMEKMAKENSEEYAKNFKSNWKDSKYEKHEEVFSLSLADNLVKFLPDEFIIKILKKFAKSPLSLVILTDFKEIFEEVYYGNNQKLLDEKKIQNNPKLLERIYYKQNSELFVNKKLGEVIQKYSDALNELQGPENEGFQKIFLTE